MQHTTTHRPTRTVWTITPDVQHGWYRVRRHGRPVGHLDSHSSEYIAWTFGADWTFGAGPRPSRAVLARLLREARAQEAAR